MYRSLAIYLSAALILWIGVAASSAAFAFKPEMHIRTTNVAIYDAMDGGICLPGLSSSTDPGTTPPEQIWLGNTDLQHLWATLDENGDVQTEFRTWLPQYAPMMRAGAIGPDGFPDPLIGQLFTHENHSEKVAPAASGLPFNSPAFDTLFDHSPPGTLQKLGATLAGKPKWRSIDWGHEVLYRALHFRQDEIDQARANGNRWLAESLVEARRPAIAFALGYLMHMIGDGQVHAMINETVGKPWGYTDTTRYEDGYYRWMSPLKEELQHMAIERYINSAFSPGSESLSDRAAIDGGICAPMIPGSETRLMCLNDTDYIEPPVPCEYCNPLRGGDPSHISDRCDHCFEGCNPWKELCPPTIPTGAGNSCDDVCDDLQKSLCDEFTDEVEKRDCLTKLCTTERLQCLCEDGVAVLTELGVLPADDPTTAQFTCQGSPFGAYAERAERIATEMLSQYNNEVIATVAERAPALSEASEGLAKGACGTDALDGTLIHAQAKDPADQTPQQVSVTINEQMYSVSSAGPEIDLNENGEPDLLNECVLLNCRINAHSCPWSALDRDTDEKAQVDIRTCFEPELSGDATIHGEVAAVCDGGDGSPLAVKVDPRRLFSADMTTREEAAQQFMSSSYIEVPQNFVADAFYLDRRYYDETAGGPAPEPGAPGTYSLGGYPVNAVHVILDALRMLEMWTTAVIQSPMALLNHLAPNSEPATVYTAFVPTVDLWIDALMRTGDALHNSPLLNFTIVIWVPNINLSSPLDIFSEPFVKQEIVVDLGKRMAKAFYSQAALLSSFRGAFNEVFETVAASINSQISLRRERLHNHLREGWVDATTCAAESVANGAHRTYSINKFKDFARDAVDILVTGQATCQRPPIADAIVDGDFTAVDFGNIIAEIHHLVAWFQCRLMEFFFGGVLEEAVIKPLEEMLQHASEQLFCDTLLSDNQQMLVAGPDELDKLRVSCTDIHTVLWAPEERLTEPAIQVALQGLDKTIELASGEQVNLRDFVRRMRMVTLGSCWDGTLTTNHLTPRNQLLASFGDSDLEQEVIDPDNGMSSVEKVCPLDWPWIEPGATDPAPPEAQFVDTLDTWMNLKQRDVEVLNDDGTALVAKEREIMTTSSFAPAYNAIQLSKLALLGPGTREPARCWYDDEECGDKIDSCIDCKPPATTPATGGVRLLIDKANAVTAIGSGDPGWRADTDLYCPDPGGNVVGPLLTSNSTAELEEFFAADYVSGSPMTESKPGKRRCSDLNWNLLCDSIYSLDDPDDYCRHAPAWSVVEGFGTPRAGAENDACVWRAAYENPCELLDGVYDDHPKVTPYRPDARRGSQPNEDPWMCNARYWTPNAQGTTPHGGQPWPADEHWDAATPHQRSFWIDASRRGFAERDDVEHGYGYNLTRFALANKDSHVARLYAKTFAPFYCPDAGADQADGDCDGIPDACDNCPDHYNPTQYRSGYGAAGEACAAGTEPADRRCLDPTDDADGDGEPDADADADADADELPVIECNCAVGPGGAWDASLMLFALLIVARRIARRRKS